MREKIAFTILRAGLGVVFLIFGIGKFQDDAWAQVIRNMEFFIRLPWSVGISVMTIAITETTTGIALILGIFTRFFALAATLMLTGILILLGFRETRDIGLLATAIFLLFVRKDSFTIGTLFRIRK